MKTQDFQQEKKAASREIIKMIFDVQSFISAVLKFKEPVGPGSNHELKLRIVEVKDGEVWQFTRASESENLQRGEAMKKMSELMSGIPLSEAHVMTSDRDLHCRVSKKGRVLISRSKSNLNRDPAASRSHNREKDYPLTRFDSSKLLLVIGLSDPEGEIKPTMRAKYRQVNEFLRIIDATLDALKFEQNTPIQLFDAGCGKSYLSFSAKAYLEATRGVEIKLTGIDINEKIIRSCRRMAESLGWDESGACFIASDIGVFKPVAEPDIVMSLHACDTATDDAMAFGVEHSARAILCAPCCQHELQSQLGTTGRNRAVLRNGILRERLADILTDAFRAQILRIMGYRANVVEFIEPEATARNIMIRAVRASRAGLETALAEYLDLRDEWGSTPYLAKRLSDICPELCS